MSGPTFKEFTARNYAEQGKAFLNAYWKEHEGDAEKVWLWANKFTELDLDKKGEGSDLDEFNAHRFLESLPETKTVRQMRTEIVAADLDFNKRLALLEYCIWRFNHTVTDFVKRPQGGDSKTQAELKKAEQMLAQVKTAFEAATATADAARKAQRELDAALKELKAQEDAYNTKTADLTQRSETGGNVSRNKAKNELAQHLAEDPLPLRRAKITTEAAKKKADAAKAAAEAAEDDARKKLKEAEEYLEMLRKQPGAQYGALWWIDRELAEKRKYLPQRKQG